MAVSLLQLLGGVSNPSALPSSLESNPLKGQEGVLAGLAEVSGNNAASLSFIELLAQHKQHIVPTLVSKEKTSATQETATQAHIPAQEDAYFAAVIASLKHAMEEDNIPATVGNMPPSLELDATDAQTVISTEMLHTLWQQHYGEPLDGYIQPLHPTNAVEGAVVFAPVASTVIPIMGDDTPVETVATIDVHPDDVVAGYVEVQTVPLPTPLAQPLSVDATDYAAAEIIVEDMPSPLRYTALPPPRPTPLFSGQHNDTIFAPKAEFLPPSQNISSLSPASQEQQPLPALDVLSVVAKQLHHAEKSVPLTSIAQDVAPLVNQPSINISLPIDTIDAQSVTGDNVGERASLSSVQELSPSTLKDTPLIRLHLQEDAVARTTPYEQMAVHIRQLHSSNKKGQLTVQLHPAELGRVDIRLSAAEDGSMMVRVMTELRDTYELLRHDKAVLERILQDSGLQMQHGSLEFAHQQRGEQQDAKEFTDASQALSPATAEVLENTPSMENEALSSLTWVATTGINIRV
jgi:hypothetical protein